MSAALGQALANYVATQLTGITPAVVVLAHSSGDGLPTGSASVVCQLLQTWDVGTLHTGPAEIKITTPSQVAGYTIATHQLLVKSVRDALIWQPTDDEEQAAINAAKDTALRAAIASVPGCTYDGHCPAIGTPVSDIQGVDGWQTTLPLTFAISIV